MRPPGAKSRRSPISFRIGPPCPPNEPRSVSSCVIVLRYQEDLDYAEIAEVTGTPLGTVKTFLHRGRQALACELRKAGWGPADSGETGRPDVS